MNSQTPADISRHRRRRLPAPDILLTLLLAALLALPPAPAGLSTSRNSAMLQATLAPGAPTVPSKEANTTLPTMRSTNLYTAARRFILSGKGEMPCVHANW